MGRGGEGVRGVCGGVELVGGSKRDEVGAGSSSSVTRYSKPTITFESQLLFLYLVHFFNDRDDQ